ALRGSGRSTSDHSSFARKALLIVQATLSVALVAGATMLARSLNKLEHQDFGYKIQGRVLVDFLRPPAAYTAPKLAALYRADDETSEPVAIVNQAFVKRFFKPGEDPIDQHFGLDLPENTGTFRIAGIVRDAKFAGWGLDRPARPMFYVPLAQYVNYKDAMM